MSIEYRKLGKTDLEISPIGLGIMQFAGGKGLFKAMFPSIAEEERNEIIKTAIEGGINWFDTAELYGAGQSEIYLSRALQLHGIEDQDVLIATKWSPFLRFASNIPKTIQTRMNNLHPYQIDLHQIHNPWSFSSPEKEMEMMAGLVAKGHIRSVGVSNFNSNQMLRAYETLEKYDIPLASNQVHYNLVNREIETNGVLQTARELGVSIIAYSPLASGLLTGKFHKNPDILSKTPVARRRQLKKQLTSSQPVIDVLNEMADSYRTTPGQVALSWVIRSQGEEIVAIPGASQVGHVVESIAAMSLQLTDEDLALLDRETRIYREK